MVHVIMLPLLICGMGLLTTTASQITNISARLGDDVTIWCKHTLEIGQNMHWFKQTNSAVPLSIAFKMLPYDMEVKAKYLNGFRPDHLVMSLNSKNSSLRILNVDISDSGLYFCGWIRWWITFGDGTHLDIKERSVTPQKNETEITNKDLKKSMISTKDCPGNIYYKLTFSFAGIIIILVIIPLTLVIVKIRKTKQKHADQHVTQHHEEPHSTLYAALRFSKQKTRRAARHAEDNDVVYSATR